MAANFERCLAVYAAPTLAGHKCGSMFTFPGDARQAAAKLARPLGAKGVRLAVLSTCPAGSLVYVYRPALLADSLQDAAAAAFLAGLGYRGGVKAHLKRLKRRICPENFPHEAGIFLGYPLEDVEGFILHRGRNYRCNGCWKVYGDVEEARRRFALYRRCQSAYRRLFLSGYDVVRLTVAV